MFISSISFVISNSSSGKLVLTSIVFKSVPFLFLTLTAFLVLALSSGMAHTSDQCGELQCQTKYTDSRRPDLDSYRSSDTQRMQHQGNGFCSLFCRVLNWKTFVIGFGAGSLEVKRSRIWQTEVHWYRLTIKGTLFFYIIPQILCKGRIPNNGQNISWT